MKPISACLWLFSMAIALAGCGGSAELYPISGTVKFDDGSPLAGGSVELRNVTTDLTKQVNARGEIGPDGKYELQALAGDHDVVVYPKVSVEPASLNSQRPPAPIDRKFMAYETSGLKTTVQKDKPNNYDIKVGQRIPGSK